MRAPRSVLTIFFWVGVSRWRESRASIFSTSSTSSSSSSPPPSTRQELRSGPFFLPVVPSVLTPKDRYRASSSINQSIIDGPSSRQGPRTGGKDDGEGKGVEFECEL